MEGIDFCHIRNTNKLSWYLYEVNYIKCFVHFFHESLQQEI